LFNGHGKNLKQFLPDLMVCIENLFKFEGTIFKHIVMVEFNQVLVNNAEFLKPFAVTLTRDSESAKDLYQETLFRALANQDKYNVGTNIKAWLYTIMRNIFINNYRRRIKQQTILDSTPNEYLINLKQAVTGNTAESDLRLKDIQEEIHKLPEIFRIPFLLYFDGYKYHEIAGMLEEPLGTIKSRIHFARKLLKSQINRY
jgi:RNA polymerase sigma-70 factor (ECF subfamily)